MKGQRRHQTSEVGAGCLTHNTLGLNPSLGPAEAGGLTLGGGRIRRDLEDLQTQAEGLWGMERGEGGGWPALARRRAGSGGGLRHQHLLRDQVKRGIIVLWLC